MNKFKHYDEGSIILSKEFYEEMEQIVQRVVDDMSQDKKKVKIGSNEYTLKKLPDGKVWMMENLQEYVEGAMWNEQYNCYMYTFNQAYHAVPEGYHLPSAQEFMKLAMALGYLKDSEEIVSERLQEYCGFVFSGFAYDTGGLRAQGRDGYYWSSTQYDATTIYHLVFSSEVDRISYSSNDHRMAVRLIKD